MKQEKQVLIPFSLEDWRVYTSQVRKRNKKAWKECEKINKKMRDDFESKIEERRKTWIATTGSEFGFYRGMCGYVTPLIERESIEGCLDWLLENKKQK